MLSRCRITNRQKYPGVETESSKANSRKTPYNMYQRDKKNLGKLGSNCSDQKQLDTLRGGLSPTVNEKRFNVDDRVMLK